MLIELIRHGETLLNAQGRYQGRTDTPLSPEGRRKLSPAGASPEHVYVSPLIRARETASVLFPGARQIVVEGLQEMDFGNFEGKSFADMKHDPAYRAWVDSLCTGKCPGGESRQEFCDRVCAAFRKILQLEKNTKETVYIVAHGGTQMAVLNRFAAPERTPSFPSGLTVTGMPDHNTAGQRNRDGGNVQGDDYYSWQLPAGNGYILEAEGRWDSPILGVSGVRSYVTVT